MRRHLPCFTLMLLGMASCGGRAKHVGTAPPAMPMPVALPPSPAPTPAPAYEETHGSGEAIVVATGQSTDRAEDDTGSLSVAQGEAPVAQGAPPPPPLPVAAAATVLPEQMVVQGSVALVVEDPEATARALRDEVARLGGRVISEQVDGAAASWRAQIRLRLLPARVVDVVSWIEKHGEITSKRMEATDVSRTLFDQEIALANLTMTLGRLRKLLEGGGLSMQDILGIEREMTRLRGEIERIKGEKRFLEDRVALATLDIYVSRRDGTAVMSPRSKVYPGPRLAVLTLFAPDGRERTRVGGGFVMHLAIPRLTLELDVFDDVEASDGQLAEGHAVLATFGASMYSDFLGRGQRRFLNPYLGFRVGYAYLDHHALALQGEAGVELFKHEYLMLDAGVRPTAVIGDHDVDAGLVFGASAVFAF